MSSPALGIWARAGLSPAAACVTAPFSREGAVPTGAFPIQLCAAAADISFYSQICFLGNK